MDNNCPSPTANSPDCNKILDDTTLESLAAVHSQNADVLEIANKKFEELCITLESEQTRLLDLEQRRRQLQEEMQKLRQEIEEERKFYSTALEETAAFGFEESPRIPNDDDQTSKENWGVDTDEVRNFIQRQKVELDKTCNQEIKVHSMETDKNNQTPLSEGESDTKTTCSEAGETNEQQDELFFSDND